MYGAHALIEEDHGSNPGNLLKQSQKWPCFFVAYFGGG
nr:MAG TPA: hypothetical protein [Bacteriophage sp.]